MIVIIVIVVFAVVVIISGSMLFTCILAEMCYVTGTITETRYTRLHTVAGM